MQGKVKISGKKGVKFPCMSSGGNILIGALQNMNRQTNSESLENACSYNNYRNMLYYSYIG